MQYSITRDFRGSTFSPPSVRARVMMVPFATDANNVEVVLELGENQHHAWGVKELLKAGVEVTVVRREHEKIERFGQDLRLPDTSDYDLIYSNHNLLIRTPTERLLGLRKTPLISLVYSGEPLWLPQMHYGVMCMTPHAHRRFKASATQAMYAPWGIDPESRLHEPVESTGDHFVTTGVTERDFDVMFNAARIAGEPLILAARGQAFENAPANVKVIKDMVGPWEIRDLYAGAAGGLVILKRDDKMRLAVGWTNILELLAVGVPVIKTRTGCLDEIVDIEEIGAGFLVEPGDVQGLVQAMKTLREDKELQRSMGEKGAAYVREHLNMEKFAQPLIEAIDFITR